MAGNSGPKKTAGGSRKKRRIRNGGFQYADPAAQAVYDHHMYLLSEAKHYFFLLYGSHEFLNEVLELLVVAPELKAVVSSLYAYQEGDNSGLDGLDPKLAILVYEGKKKRSEAFIACKTNLLFSVIFSLQCFRHLEANEVRAAIWEYGKASYHLGGCIGAGAVLFGDESVAALSKRGALARLKNDPRQHEKQLVRDCWDMWCVEPSRYPSKAAFARDMLAKYENLKSQPVIEGWCRDWEAEAKRSTDQSAS